MPTRDSEVSTLQGYLLRPALPKSCSTKNLMLEVLVAFKTAMIRSKTLEAGTYFQLILAETTESCKFNLQSLHWGPAQSWNAPHQ